MPQAGSTTTDAGPFAPLAGRTAFVTGGGSGIGAACAQRLAAGGATVGVADRDPAAARAVAAVIPGATALEVDVADGASVDRAIAELVERTGGLDIAVNCAGVGGPRRRVHEYTGAEWRSVLAVDLDGVFECVRAEVAVMIPTRRGSIVNVSSVLGSAGMGATCAYVAAKHGVEGLTKAAALDYARDGIRVNAVAPGFIATELVRSRMSAEEVRALGARHPMARIGEAAEVAEVVAFLASDQSAFVTGSTYRVDGGYLTGTPGN